MVFTLSVYCTINCIFNNKEKYSNNTEIIFISILSISGYLLSKYSNIMLPWVLESALISTIFIYCGYKNELKKKIMII